MRIVGGEWRGHMLTAPPGLATRPTADRARQALFDVLMHAPWGGPGLVEGASVLDGFAGTGALGLEALSRGASRAVFIERDRAALAALRANIRACGAGERARVIAGDAMAPPPAPFPCRLVFLDPPYGQELGTPTVAGLARAGWLAPGATVVLELGRREALPNLGTLLDVRQHGAAQITVWRVGQSMS